MGEHETQLMRRAHEEHAEALHRFCLSLTGYDHARSQDVVQETLLRAWRHPEVLAGSPPALRSWLFTVARRVVIDEWRSHRAHPELPVADPPEADPGPDETDQVLVSWVVADALSRLSEEHRDVLRQTYFRGRSVAEASRALGVPEGTVKSRTHYALRALRLALQEMGVGA